MYKYPDDPDLYYNVGVLYQRLTLEMFDPVRDLFLKTTAESDPSIIMGIYETFKTTRQYAYNSKDYFLQACAYSKMWEVRTGEAIDQLVILVAVDNSDPQVFITDSDEWHDELKSVIYENRQRVRQGT